MRAGEHKLFIEEVVVGEKGILIKFTFNRELMPRTPPRINRSEEVYQRIVQEQATGNVDLPLPDIWTNEHQDSDKSEPWCCGESGIYEWAFYITPIMVWGKMEGIKSVLYR